MSGYTKGRPWEVATDFPRSRGWRVGAPIFPGSSVRKDIAVVSDEGTARLIAAAPDMLEALKATLDHPLVHIPGEIEIAIRAAIQKAEQGNG